MAVRIASVVLWFVAGAWASNYLGLLFGFAPIVGLALAVILSVLIATDPMRLFWPVRIVKAQSRSTAPVPVQGQVRSDI